MAGHGEALRRVAEHRRTRQRHHEVGDPEREEGAGGVVGLAVDERLGDRRGEHRTEAEAADRQAGDQALPVGEPLLQ